MYRWMMNHETRVFCVETCFSLRKDDPEWKIGMPWLLKATFSSDSQAPRNTM